MAVTRKPRRCTSLIASTASSTVPAWFTEASWRSRSPARHRPGELRRGLAVPVGPTPRGRDFPGQVRTPPKKPGKNASPEETARWEQHRHQQSSQRICVEHASAEPRQWRPLQRYPGRREYFEQTALAIAGLISDRTAAR